jgi:hypothetical protein
MSRCTSPLSSLGECFEVLVSRSEQILLASTPQEIAADFLDRLLVARPHCVV